MNYLTYIRFKGKTSLISSMYRKDYIKEVKENHKSIENVIFENGKSEQVNSYFFKQFLCFLQHSEEISGN